MSNQGNGKADVVTAVVQAPVATAIEAPAAPLPHAPQVNQGFSSNPGYVRQSRGYPVQPGQTWHDLTPAQRQEWMRNHESRWKSKFGLQNVGVQANLNWTRG